MSQQTVPRIESLRVKNYRALRDVELKKHRCHGSGKSTLFDVLRFSMSVAPHRVPR